MRVVICVHAGFNVRTPLQSYMSEKQNQLCTLRDWLDARSKKTYRAGIRVPTGILVQEAGMKGKLLTSASVLLGLVAFCGPLFAHHGNAAYQDKPIVLKQVTVTQFSWTNPHSLIEFDAK